MGLPGESIKEIKERLYFCISEQSSVQESIFLIEQINIFNRWLIYKTKGTKSRNHLHFCLFLNVKDFSMLPRFEPIIKSPISTLTCQIFSDYPI